MNTTSIIAGLRRQPWRTLRITLVFLLGLVVTWFALTEIVYQVRVEKIAPHIAPPPQGTLPLKIRQVAWVHSGEVGKMRMRPAHLGWFPVAFFGPAFLEKHPRKLWYGSGFCAAGDAQKIFYEQAGQSFEKRLLAMIWITRHWTADQVLSGTVGHWNYECEGYDLDTASLVLFKRSPDSLSLPQVVALLSLNGQLGKSRGRDTAYYRKRFESLQDRVIENFPELASEKGPMPRFLVSACPARSDSL